MRFVIVKGVALGLVCVSLLCIFTSVQGKDTALLQGGCGSVSGRESGETRFRVVWFVKLGGCLIVWGNRIFFGSMFNSLNINSLWNTTLLKWWKSAHC